MDYNELQFASTVLSLANKIRAEVQHSIYKTLTGEVAEKNELMNQWQQENPVEPFIHLALEKLRNTALIIKEIESTQLDRQE